MNMKSVHWNNLREKRLNYTAKKLPRKVSLLWQMECNKISCQLKTNPSALDYLTDAFFVVVDGFSWGVRHRLLWIFYYLNWQLPLITWELVLYCLAQTIWFKTCINWKNSWVCIFAELGRPTWTLHWHLHSPDTLVRYTLPVLGWNLICLQNCFNSSWHRFNTVLETFLRVCDHIDMVKSCIFDDLKLVSNHQTTYSWILDTAIRTHVHSQVGCSF